MTIFKSQQVNLDPEPWLCDYEIDGKPVRSFFDGHGRYTWAPRREQFDTPVNRVLLAFREDVRLNPYTAGFRMQAEVWLIGIDFGLGQHNGSTQQEIDHARRVLTRLANWKDQ